MIILAIYTYINQFFLYHLITVLVAITSTDTVTLQQERSSSDNGSLQPNNSIHISQ